MARRGGSSRQPRDRRGRWASYGSGGGAAAASSGGSKKMTHADSVKRLKELDKYEKAKAKKTGKGSAAANNIRKSPRNLTKQEKIAADVMANKRLRSDKARKAEMIKRGISPDTDFVELVGRARDKARSKRK